MLKKTEVSTMNRIINSTLFLVIFFLLHHPLLTQAAPSPPDTFLDIPLTGIVQVPLSNGSMDTVPISGIFHVVSHVSGDSSGIAYGLIGDLANVSGTGNYTGLLYEATPSWLEVITPPQIPGKPLDIFGRTYLVTTVSTMMFPPDSCPAAGICVIPLNVYFTASFDPTGLMNAITINAVSIPSGE
jgi:hypothetical protein